MTKSEFLWQLRNGLQGLPRDDIEERVNFYSEMIDDRMEEGLSEAEAVSEIGDVNTVVAQILEETPLAKIVKEKVKPSRAIKVWEIVFLVLGSPIWLSLLIAAFSVFLAVYIVIWSVVVALWSIEVSFVACALGGFVAAAVFGFRGNVLIALAMLSAGICLAGLSILMFFACKAVTKAMVWLTGKIALGIKTMFVGKGKKND